MGSEIGDLNIDDPDDNDEWMNDDDEDSRSTTLQLPDYLGCLYLKEDWLGQPNVPLDLIALNQVIAIQIYRLQIITIILGIYI